MKGGTSSGCSGGGGSRGAPPLRLPLPSGCFLDHLPPAQKRARFNLLLLEHGEVYLGACGRAGGWMYVLVECFFQTPLTGGGGRGGKTRTHTCTYSARRTGSLPRSLIQPTDQPIDRLTHY
jgi:hypothetical protein